MAKFVQYGDRRMPLEGDMTKDQAKDLMQRFFPELGDPAIETKKEGDDTVYVFSKRAGRKGCRGGARPARGGHPALRLSKLLRLKPSTLVQPWMLQAAVNPGAPNVRRDAEQAAAELAAEAGRVRSVVTALLDLPSIPSDQGASTGSVLL